MPGCHIYDSPMIQTQIIEDNIILDTNNLDSDNLECTQFTPLNKVVVKEKKQLLSPL